MTLNRKNKLIIGGAALLAAAGGGVAVAASGNNSPSAESKAVIDDAAKQLGIPSGKLSSALKKALDDRVDAAVAAGRITKAEGDAIKQRIAADDFPLVGGGFHRGGGFRHFGGLDAAAAYIGISEDQLHTALEGGKTLAQVAKDHGKTADGLVSALYADAKAKLDEAVSAGRLTKTRETDILSSLKDRIAAMVNSIEQDGRRFRSPRLGFRQFDGPPS
jgi:uncharacterized protein YidB (DUF937 family)